jgi:glycine/D-amino acid oxidase-like deaminating enzyme/nitrite reductase/ring-hydroxylating ferredoxin subunit
MVHTDPEDGASRSAWTDRPPALETEPLGGPCEAEVCVIGAGIAGVSTAYQLAKDGRSVVLLDDGAVGGGQTHRTTAHLASVLDDRFRHLERLHGGERTRLAAASHAVAIDAIEKNVHEEGIECGFERVDGYLLLGEGDTASSLDDELAAAQRAGLADARREERPPLPDLRGPCLRFPRQAQIHPLRYLHGLARAAQHAGVRLFTGTHAEAVEVASHGCSVRVGAGHAVRADAVVVATNTPIHERVAIHTKQAPYRTYAISMEVPAGVIPRALYWDTEDPYHYVRLHAHREEADRELLIVGGEDHRIRGVSCAEAVDRYTRLEDWARARFPSLGRVVHRWSGEVMEPVDGLAFIGRGPSHPERVFVATGDSGMGMTHGAFAGILLADLIAGRPNPWSALYDPSRKSVGAAATWLSENATTALAYGDWLRLDTTRAEKVRPGEGRVLGLGLDRLAVHREADGALHVRSAVCPHLGGLVEWNEAEQTWDCPCHGSRFDRFGRVVHGPANSDLAIPKRAR